MLLYIVWKLREQSLNSHQKEKNFFYCFDIVSIWDDGFSLNLLPPSFHKVVVTLLHCTPQNYTALCVNYISKLEDKNLEFLLWLSGLRARHSVGEEAGLIPGPDQWIEDRALLWLWCRLAASAPIRPRGWEFPYAADAAIKRKKKGRKKI